MPSTPIGSWSKGKSKRLGIDIDPLEAAVRKLRKQVDDRRLPGFLTSVFKDGQLVHCANYGCSDLCSGAPMRLDALFRLYSQTKPLTIVTFMRLLERGAVRLSDPLAMFIPSFQEAVITNAVAESQEQGTHADVGPITPRKKKQPPSVVQSHRPLVVRDLLAHTSGIGFGPGFGYDAENDYEQSYADLVGRVDRLEVASLADWCEELAKLPLRFQPGSDWGYGYSCDVLGRVIEVVSGQPLDACIQAEVIEPLGMNDTSFAVPAEKSKRLGALYNREPWDGSGPSKKVRFVTVDPGGSGLVADDGSRNVYARASENDTDSSAPSSSVFLQGAASKIPQGGGCVCSVAGGLVSSLHDYARFAQMLANDGEVNGVRLLRPESVQLLRRDWLNDFSEEKRQEPLWVWDTPGIGFSPLGQIGVKHPQANRHRACDSALDTIHWGGAGGSGYMINWPHRIVVLTYTGCTYDTQTQKAMWRASFSALRRGGSCKVAPLSANLSAKLIRKPRREMRRLALGQSGGLRTRRRGVTAGTKKNKAYNGGGAGVSRKRKQTEC